ncbi:hypothetical protein L228DRAFT_235072 [Xylona heveae TC161]|uniref:Inositolphosphotransferase Aur1/Ipt1 domain-containing protein n=1 Tax=Xylona heveae (strain CBS 132557 / TC161) TaxID=1328760 RepID=A0A165J9S5_XYLHT|nr:hypothetical protein L228DRAFT_235072 [Xylona heveae TC161]KZF25945.1 hypothetical protein L228DRAFT_235072 [Xylona heveae TC161]
MGVGAFVEPFVVVFLLFGGTWINRDFDGPSTRPGRWTQDRESAVSRDDSPDSISSGSSGAVEEDTLLGDSPTRSASPSLLVDQESKWRKRHIGLFGLKHQISTPNTRVFQGRLLSRLLQKLPFLVECWYWALVYWIYQLGRAFSALTLKDTTVDVARNHALQVIHLEQKLHIFWELPIQHFFLKHPFLLTWINRIYSFIHIPGTILFLVWLYYYTTTRNRLEERQSSKKFGEVSGSPAGPGLYQARRRTMAVCNLLAFIVFTLWPCMPPRLLSDKHVKGPVGDEARSYGFVDTVHGKGGESSVWTQNKFCNQYAAMPSLHFGYSLMIGLTVVLVPLPPHHRRSMAIKLPYIPSIRLPSWRRLLCVIIGMLYPLTILIAIIATANHFILDAVAGAIVCGLGWWGNSVLLNLLPIEDCFLWCLRIHKPEPRTIDVLEGDFDENGQWVVGKGVVV